MLALVVTALGGGEPAERPSATTPRNAIASPDNPPPSADTRPPPRAAPAACGPDLDARVRRCIAAGNNACVIRLLTPCQRSPSFSCTHLALLIEVHRARGETTRAIELMHVSQSRCARLRGDPPVGDFWEQWDAALEEFARSYALSGSPAALFNMASTLRALGRFREARDAIDRLLEDPYLDEATRANAGELRAEVAANVSRVTLEGVPEGWARVHADGALRETTQSRPIQLDLDPGHRVLRLSARAPGTARRRPSKSTQRAPLEPRVGSARRGRAAISGA